VLGVTCLVLRVWCYMLRVYEFTGYELLRLTSLLRVTCYVFRVTCYLLRVTWCYVLRVTCYVLRGYVLRVTCYVLRVWCLMIGVLCFVLGVRCYPSPAVGDEAPRSRLTSQETSQSMRMHMGAHVSGRVGAWQHRRVWREAQLTLGFPEAYVESLFLSKMVGPASSATGSAGGIHLRGTREKHSVENLREQPLAKEGASM